MDDKKEINPKGERKERKPYTQEKPMSQVKAEIVAKSMRIKGRVRELYQHDAKPIYIDKGS